ncbi:MAG: NADPH:quinone reductase-like Zn-dependent oxidoreductase [Myxococcota bacterium]|jgi:NADPH:quinone reductase-like Zn-dependent oxidoreductase
MRRVVVRGAGGPEVLHLTEEADPVPGRGQVRLRVEAAGVAFGDVMRRRGVLAPRGPFTPGYDVVGVIDAVGEGVDSGLRGVRVAAMMPRTGIGGYASHVLLKKGGWVPVPLGIEPVAAVALGLNFITAWQILHRILRLQPGKRLLVHGAAGGVGTAALMLAQLQGLEVYGTASAAKHPMVEKHGAIPIDYRSEDFVERIREIGGVDGVLDPIGGEHLEQSWESLRGGGTLVAFGTSGGLTQGLWGAAVALAPWLRLRATFGSRKARLYMIGLSPVASAARCREDWAELLAMHARGELVPEVGATLPLEEVREAHELMDRAAVMGKIVLTVG